MDNRELQRRLKSLDFHGGAIDGDVGKYTVHAVNAFLNHGRVAVPQAWTKARRIMAAKQLLCRMDGIEVGSIDGLFGPQTDYAFTLYAERAGGNGGAPFPDRSAAADSDPDSRTGMWPRESAVPGFFGPMGAHQVRLRLPFSMRIAWDLGKSVDSFLIHEKVHDSALRCFHRIADAYDATARARTGIDLFGGCLHVRRKRGGSSWSMHAWGIAIDFDPARNGLRSTRQTARLAQSDCETFWRIWEDEGWVSLGRTRDFDWMHVQAARL